MYFLNYKLKEECLLCSDLKEMLLYILNYFNY